METQNQHAYSTKSAKNAEKIIEPIDFMNKHRLTRHIKNLSNVELTNDQTNLLAKGLKFIPNQNKKKYI